MIRDPFKSNKKGYGLLRSLLEKEKMRKIAVSVTIDEDIYNKIKKLKEDAGIKEFSPIINELLKKFFEQQKEETSKS